MARPAARTLRLKTSAVHAGAGRSLPLPTLLAATSRGGTPEVDPLLAGVTVEKIYALAASTRDVAAGPTETLPDDAPELLALEAEDGSTLFIRSDALAEAIAERRPEAIVDGEVDLARFQDPNLAARGIADLVWKTAAVLRLPADGLFEEALDEARQAAKDKLGEKIEAKAYAWGSLLAVRALLAKIESRLAGRPGLYRWSEQVLAASDRVAPGDARLAEAAAGKPMLVLIHGTGSYTVGSFSDLRHDEATWSALVARFPGGIFGFEHRTFSQSPAENAAELLDALPAGARVSLLTHSRGGLVGDLLCLGQVDDGIIGAYSIDSEGADDVAGLELEAAEERERLRTIRDRLNSGAIVVERYVRVACPARGTRFLSENLDAALSDFLNLMQWGGGALLGATAAALGGPVAGQAIGSGASSCLGVVKRLVLEIAGRRIDPRLVPGIAAMRIDSPLAAFLADPGTHRRDGVAMAVIAGDTEFEGVGLSNLRRRIANLFCDWRLFDSEDNDLVVDSDSMLAGLAFRPGARYLFDQNASVTHFRYFINPTTRDALRAFMTDDEASVATRFLPLESASKLSWRERDARIALRDAANESARGPRPVAILIPGIMGTHIEIDRKNPGEPGSGRRVWFDLSALLLGRLARIADVGAANVAAEDLFERFYGDLAEHLAQTHAVFRCPYDWRQSVEQCALALRERVEAALAEHPGQPINLVAHSMGGLVTRTLIRRNGELWQKIIASGGRLVMLGTPNRGAHQMVHSLLGKANSLRMLAKLDTAHGLQEVLDIVAGFPGGLALLPRPGFTDSGSEARIAPADYYAVETWQALKAKSTDRWYGDGVVAVPPRDFLADTERFWNETLPDNTIANPERVAYVFGQGEKTACGVQQDAEGRLKLLFTPDGDGTVTWASGELDNLDLETRCWTMPVEHGDLASSAEYFPAITDLVTQGTTERLRRLPRRRSAEASTFVLEAPPPVFPGEDELARACVGAGALRRRVPAARSALKVAVRAGDLRFLDQPVLCGHYIGDAISGAEASLDELLAGALAERERLGAYAEAIGSSAIVLRPPSSEQSARGSRLGAVIVGLGRFTGQLSARQVSETVRAGVLRFLLQLRDALQVKAGAEVELYSLLIGWNSTASISVAESVAAVTRGVLEANHQFSQALGGTQAVQEFGATVSKLSFIELYRNAAIAAAHAVVELPDKLADECTRLGARIDPAATLVVGEGVMDRLNIEGDLGHWSRLIVSDADTAEETNLAGRAVPPLASRSPRPADDDAYPERLKYVFLSQRARAEAFVQQRQPGLIEAIIREQRRNPAYDAKLGRTLFQLMVPADYKALAREQSRLLLVLDSYTARLPWELLQADGEPLVLNLPMVRQLTTLSYRTTVRIANVNSACVIVAPSTEGFSKRFAGPERLPDLPAAVREGSAVTASLRGAGWTDVIAAPPEREALDVFATLYERPYRVLMISGHGLFEATANDGRCYSGVVLSDGLLMTAVEIELMEVVPEIVFLNCCHLGSVNHAYSEPNQLAYSLARKLIEIGVRCVVAAGWAVDDEAACTFATTFFNELTRGETFGEAIFTARKATFLQHPASNTWGAYQAYGDPGFRLQVGPTAQRTASPARFVAVEELLALFAGERLKKRRRQNARGAPSVSAAPADFETQRQWVLEQLARCPAQWADDAEVLQAIAELYAEYGDASFAATREAYARAIAAADGAGRVALRAIEQLANIEARQGALLALGDDLDAAIEMIDSAISRLQALSDAVQGAIRAETVAVVNSERAALLGSAYKLKAATLARQGRKWAVVAASLERAAQTYRLAGGPGGAPYNTLNALVLAWLAGTLELTPTQAASLARECGEAARLRFATSKDFWDAVLAIDAELTAWLVSGRLFDSGDAAPEAVLQRRYEEAAQSLPASARQWDSVVGQWRFLAEMLRLSGRRNASRLGATLFALANHFDPQAGTAPAPVAAATKAAPRPRQRAGRARKPSRAKPG